MFILQWRQPLLSTTASFSNIFTAICIRNTRSIPNHLLIRKTEKSIVQNPLLLTMQSGRMPELFGIEFEDHIVISQPISGSEKGGHTTVIDYLREEKPDVQRIDFMFPKRGKGLENIERRRLINGIVNCYLRSRNEEKKVYSAFMMVDNSLKSSHETSLLPSKSTVIETVTELPMEASDCTLKSLDSYLKGVAILSDSQELDEKCHLFLSEEFEKAGCPFDKFCIDFSTKAPVLIKNHLEGKTEGQAKQVCVEQNFGKANYHPVLLSQKCVPVFYNCAQALRVLQQCQELSFVDELLKRIPKQLELERKCVGLTPKHPFIVVEGMDGSGKSTLVKNLGMHLNSACFQTPPDVIKDLRRAFDSYPEMLRRAYYAIGNYIAAEMVVALTQDQPVVMDRFWHSTTAYGIANECNCGDGQYLPQAGHRLFQWPNDLIQPSAVVFTFVPEQERSCRVDARKELVTEEEKAITQSKRFRKRILAAYRRIDCPLWVEVNTSGTQEETLTIALSKLKENGIIK